MMRYMGMCLMTLGIALAAAGCRDGGTGGGAGDGRVSVVCTTTMIADLARQIGGEHVEVKGLMRPGEDPHVYDVRPRDAQAIGSADVVLANGLHLEATLAHVIANHARKDAVVVRLAESPAIKPIGDETGAPDPHCWFDVARYKVYAQGVRDALVAAAPDHADDFRSRADAYLSQLDELDAWVRAQIEAIPRERRVLVTSHDAFAYFGQAYGIDVHAVIGISTDQQPKPQDLQALESLVREHHVRALFIETSVSNTLNEIIRKIAAATGATIGGTLYSDSLGPEDSPAATYIDMIRHNTTTIVKALQ
jgi:manganese/zinc/iron transport system substrate-binding protein